MVVTMDYRLACRICLEANKQTFDIFSSYYLKRNTVYSEMLSSCTKIKPKPDDGLPRQICKECTKQLKRTFTFNLLCEESDKTLRDQLQGARKPDHAPTDHEIKNEDRKNGDTSMYGNELDVNDCVMDIIASNIVDQIKEDIKLETSFDDDANNFWDADDNILLGEIKLKNLVEDPDQEAVENTEPLKKKRGRKKRIFPVGEVAPLSLSKRPHQCDVCGKVLSTKSNLKAHKVCHTDHRPFKCDDCPAAFRGHSALFQHKKVHTRETPYHCEYCPKQFSRRTGLVNHIRMHTGEKNYRCELCMKTFVQNAQLNIHMKRHKGEKTYLCQECGKGFPIKSDLYVHQRIHNGDKPYSCRLCTKKFATSGNLSIHVRIHNKEIRYNCAECKRGFVTHSAYSLHLKRHKGQRDYHCECGKTFYTSSALKQHKVVHTGEKKFQCKLCERKFTQTSHLSRHFKRDHSKPNMPKPAIDEYRLVLPVPEQGKTFNAIENAIAMIQGVKCEEIMS